MWGNYLGMFIILSLYIIITTLFFFFHHVFFYFYILLHRQNPDFVYLFEPLRAFSEQFTWDNCRATPINEDLGKIMQSLYNCDFSVLNNSLPDWGISFSFFIYSLSLRYFVLFCLFCWVVIFIYLKYNRPFVFLE